jgi:phosphatidylserine decarboxylase
MFTGRLKRRFSPFDHIAFQNAKELGFMTDLNQLPTSRPPESPESSYMDSAVTTLGILPQRLMSFAVGGLTRVRLPRVAARPLHKAFVRTFGINMAEAEKPLDQYLTIEDIFTRKLQDGRRTVAGVAMVSPSDGKLVKSQAISQGQAMQAKGLSYSIDELVFGSLKKPSAAATWYTTIYLAPHNYHRVHAPFAGRVTALRYLSGRLWPVNGPAVRAIDNLFCKNERLVFDFDLGDGALAWVVMVGALNVGRISTPLKPQFVTNAASSLLSTGSPQEMIIDQNLQKAEEIGTFQLGSTVVIALNQKAQELLKPGPLEKERAIKLGEALGNA